MNDARLCEGSGASAVIHQRCASRYASSLIFVVLLLGAWRRGASPLWHCPCGSKGPSFPKVCSNIGTGNRWKTLTPGTTNYRIRRISFSDYYLCYSEVSRIIFFLYVALVQNPPRWKILVELVTFRSAALWDIAELICIGTMEFVISKERRLWL